MRWVTRLWEIDRDFGPVADPRARFIVEVPLSYKPLLDALLQKTYNRHNGHLDFTVDTPKRPRTTGYKSQNHHLRGHEQQIAKALGLTLTEVHETIKNELADWPEKQINGPRGERFVKLSEAEISTEVCAAAIELCHAWAAHTGVTLIEGSQEGSYGRGK